MFRIVARQFYYYQKTLSELPPENDECPSECPKGETSGAFCADCPVKEAKEGLQEFSIEELKLKCAEDWEKYGFDNLLRTVLNVSAIQDSDSTRWTITTDRLVNILKNEKYRLERIERWNNRKTE